MRDLDRYAPEHFRSAIERDFYARVNNSGRLEQLLQDDTFLTATDEQLHTGLFSDHGVVHARDVAQHVVDVLETVHGVLIPEREPRRLHAFMTSYGVLLAYLHDIGMRDCTPLGRDMHPEFATQFVFQAAFDKLLNEIWDENPGNISWRLSHLAESGDLTQPPRLVLREMLSMASCHSKSKVPVELLNDRASLRAKMVRTASAGLNRLWAEQQLERCLARIEDGEEDAAAEMEAAAATLGKVREDTRPRDNLRRYYDDPERHAFGWLVSSRPGARELADDVIDTLRCLRCADALRQRGTVLKTSGSYEILVDQMTANAIYALRMGDDQLHMVEIPAALPAGEANLSASELEHDGNLRIAFHRGAFASYEIMRRAAFFAATVVNDIQGDVIESFRRPRSDGELKRHDEILIRLEGTSDNLTFAPLVAEELLKLNPLLWRQVRTVPSMQGLAPAERDRYLHAPDVTWDAATRLDFWERVERSGQRVEAIDRDHAFEHVRIGHVRPGESLIEAGAQSGFVYIPLSDGLKVIPLGGYQSFDVAPWMPLGTTGVIRGAARNATIAADRDIDVLIIPKEVYLQHWHRPITLADLKQRFVGEQV